MFMITTERNEAVWGAQAASHRLMVGEWRLGINWTAQKYSFSASGMSECPRTYRLAAPSPTRCWSGSAWRTSRSLWAGCRWIAPTPPAAGAASCHLWNIINTCYYRISLYDGIYTQAGEVQVQSRDWLGWLTRTSHRGTIPADFWLWVIAGNLNHYFLSPWCRIPKDQETSRKQHCSFVFASGRHSQSDGLYVRVGG